MPLKVVNKSGILLTRHEFVNKGVLYMSKKQLGSRIPMELFDDLMAKAESLNMSQQEATEAALRLWVYGELVTTPMTEQVTTSPAEPEEEEYILRGDRAKMRNRDTEQVQIPHPESLRGKYIADKTRRGLTIDTVLKD
jgi:hypothetical protein